MENAVPIDATFAALAEEVAAAQKALIDAISGEPRDCWHAYELKIKARNGWSPSVMSLALNRLVEDGTFEVIERDCIRLAG